MLGNDNLQPVYTPGTIIIIARYLGPVRIVVAAMMKAMTAKYRGIVIWKYLSPVLSACQAFRKVVITPRAYGGTVKRRETTLE